LGELASLIEASAPARLLRQGLWLYPFVSILHVLGIALLFGAIAVLDLRLLGLWRRLPVPELARLALPVAVTGLALALLSGPLLFSVEAQDYIANPFFWSKLTAVALGLLNVLLLHRSAAWRRAAGEGNGSSARLRLGGAASLACWLVAIAAGRLIAYW
jgi:hypothetical protein